MISFHEIEKLCTKAADLTKTTSNNVSIDLQIKGYISYIEVGGIKKHTGVHKPTINESLNSLIQNILP